MDSNTGWGDRGDGGTVEASNVIGGVSLQPPDKSIRTGASDSESQPTTVTQLSGYHTANKAVPDANTHCSDGDGEKMVAASTGAVYTQCDTMIWLACS
jgi:hypothetical protein